MSATARAERTAEHRGGTGEPLLLIHGITASWTVWLPVIERLEAHHDVIAPALSGHVAGPALPDGSPATVSELTDGLERRLDELGLETVHVVGNSLGGWLALELARRGRARSVVALSPAGAWARPRDLASLSRQLKLGSWLLSHAGRRTAAFLSRPRARRIALRSTAERGDRVPAAAIPGILQDVAGCTVLDELGASLEGTGGIDHLPDPGCRIRIAWGECDRTIPFGRYGRPMLERVPDAEYVSLPGVGHIPMSDDPELVARTILEVTVGHAPR